ncbi:hypothetical protein CS022_10320 [Veronia nyctiphanis]|uniref:Uncharacterized protein n=1 Tax=Veronia nyctiphanis TaxID=1278244 RepID=A0A4Q0YW02_9GAMM|nr:hypothetical protein [Veronia nyctiphanis]RXJ73359.1 hypothetical protein CS022_10320 [Veronia nyctiphanis]
MASTPNKASDLTRWDEEKIDKLTDAICFRQKEFDGKLSERGWEGEVTDKMTDVVTYQIKDESSEFNTQLKLMGREKKTLRPYEASDEYSKTVYGRPPPKPVEDKDKKKKSKSK